MKLEDQVCSLELAKRLKELGVKQESIWIWAEYPKSIYPKGYKIILNREDSDIFRTSKTWYSSFTAAELGVMLPDGFRSGNCSGQFLCMVPSDNGTLESTVRLKMFDIKIEADARAKMLIHLIEKGIVKP